MADLALSAKGQIHNQMDKSLKPKLDKLLARKVKPNAMQIKKSKRASKSSRTGNSRVISPNQKDEEAV